MKILMVCLGNICRSPMAEGILDHLASAAGLAIEVDSAATSGHHSGERPDRRGAALMRKKGIPIDDQRSRQFTANDFTDFDLIYVMDSSNYNNVLALATSKEDEEKVKLILDEVHPGEHMPVPDPYFGGDDGFENVYQLLTTACTKIVADLQK